MANAKQSKNRKSPSKSRSKTQKQPTNSAASPVLTLILLIALSVLLIWLSAAAPVPGTMIGGLQDVLFGLTGSMTWVPPIMLTVLGFYQLLSTKNHRFSRLTAACIALLGFLLLTAGELIAAPAILKKMNFHSYFNFAYNAYLAKTGGGCIGSGAWFLYKPLGDIGGMIVAVALILADIALMTRDYWGMLADLIEDRREAHSERAERRRDEANGESRTYPAKKPRRPHEEVWDTDDDDAAKAAPWDAEPKPRRTAQRSRNASEDEFRPSVSPRRADSAAYDGDRSDGRSRRNRSAAPAARSQTPSFYEDSLEFEPSRSRFRPSEDPSPFSGNPLMDSTKGRSRLRKPTEDAKSFPETHTEELQPSRRRAVAAYTEEAVSSTAPTQPAARRAETVPAENPRPNDAAQPAAEKTVPSENRRSAENPQGLFDFEPAERTRLRDDSPANGDDFAGGHMHVVHGQSMLKGGSVHVSVQPTLSADDLFDSEPVRAPKKPVEARDLPIEDIFDDVPAKAPKKPANSRDLTIEPEPYEAPDEDELPFEPDEPNGSAEKSLGVFRKTQRPAETEPYNYPPLDILAMGDRAAMQDTEDADLEKAQELEDTLHSFGVEATLSGIAHGPAVTRFEFKLPRGVKVGKVASLADDIAYNLAAESVRIEAPIPGKTAVGVEIPNDRVETVPLRDVLESPDAMKQASRIAVGLGKDNAGRYIMADLAKMPHVLIAGQTGSGKSVCINSIIMSILFRSSPDEVKLILIDPKVVELSVYNDVPHLIAPVVTDPKKAASALDWAVVEMGERYKKFSRAGVRNIKGYNSHLPEGEEKMPLIVIIIDELADLMMAAPGEVEDSICRLAQLARAAGMHLVIATQRPSVNVITGLIKANVPSRIAFKVASTVDSRTIFDHGGAEKLLGNGDMLFVPSGGKMLRIQGAWVSDEEVENAVEYIKSRHENSYNEDMIDHMNRGTTPDAERDEQADDECDDRLEEAVEIVIDAGQASISMLQRKMRVGYARAGRLIDEMCRRGIVSEADGAKPRSVLITKEQFHNAFIDDEE